MNPPLRPRLLIELSDFPMTIPQLAACTRSTTMRVGQLLYVLRKLGAVMVVRTVPTRGRPWNVWGVR